MQVLLDVGDRVSDGDIVGAIVRSDVKPDRRVPPAIPYLVRPEEIARWNVVTRVARHQVIEAHDRVSRVEGRKPVDELARLSLEGRAVLHLEDRLGVVLVHRVEHRLVRRQQRVAHGEEVPELGGGGLIVLSRHVDIGEQHLRRPSRRPPGVRCEIALGELADGVHQITDDLLVHLIDTGSFPNGRFVRRLDFVQEERHVTAQPDQVEVVKRP